jgi:hypothetical protein
MFERKTAGVLFPMAILALLAAGCNGSDNTGESGETVNMAEVPVPAPDGPKLASVDKSTPIFERPTPSAPTIGRMRAGAMVARAQEPLSKDQCPGGWYPIYPRGFVCAGQEATTNLAHPTLAVMKTLPAREAPLPYRYHSTTKPTSLYEWDRSKGAAVREVGKLRRRTRLAVIGSWSAQLPEGGSANLALLPDGRFVNLAHLEESSSPDFKGTVLDDKIKLPVAFVVKQGIRSWSIDGKSATRGGPVEARTMIPLTGRFRTIGDVQFWAAQDETYVRHPDVTVVRRRDGYPDFVKPDQKWVDISVITGTVVLYEGKKPVYATLCSVGMDRLGNPETGPTTQMGTFEITAKHLTTSEPGKKPFADDHEVFDVPWAQLLSSGQMIHGAMWHSRFGVEHGPGNVQLSPTDAAYLFAWTSPAIPEGWHSVLQIPEGEPKVIVLIRK